ncbi:MAG: leucine-rich repeat protein [Cytophagales bacterium]|nr:leucine-rich repeat protein [Cytophagales bacterium]
MNKLLLSIQLFFLATIIVYSQSITINNVTYEITSLEKLEAKVTNSPNAKGNISIDSTVMIEGNNYTVTNIGQDAFAGNQLTGVVIPNSVISIDEYAFYENQLTNLVIPNNVRSIKLSAFESNKLSNIIISDSVTTIGEYAFSKNQLTKVEIPVGITIIERYVFSFNQLTDIVIPNKVEIIGEHAFSENELKNIKIPSSVKIIRESAFFENKIESVTTENNNPIFVRLGAFGSEVSQAILYVSQGSKERYENAEGWKEFGSIIEIESETTNSIYKVDINSKIETYPNPTVNDLNISISDASSLNTYKIELRNIVGSLILEEAISTQNHSIDISGFNEKGLYLLSIFNKNGKLIGIRKTIVK